MASESEDAVTDALRRSDGSPRNTIGAPAGDVEAAEGATSGELGRLRLRILCGVNGCDQLLGQVKGFTLIMNGERWNLKHFSSLDVWCAQCGHEDTVSGTRLRELLRAAHPSVVPMSHVNVGPSAAP